MITLPELRTRIQSIIAQPADSGLVLYPVLSNDDGDDIIRLADIAPDAAEELKTMIFDYLNEKFILNEELHFTNLTNADERKNTAFFYDLAEKPDGLKALDLVVQDDAKPEFSFSDDDLTRIKGFVITIGSEENHIALYKRHYHLNTLRAARTFGMFKSDHRFVKMDEDIIKLSKTIDFLQIGDELVVANLKALEDGFGYEAVIRGQAAANIQAIGALGLLEDIVALSDMANDLKQAKKIMKIKSDSPVMQLPVETVIQFVRTYRPIMRKFRLSDDGTKLKLDTAVSKKLFLSLMNDDLLTSELTKLYYAGLAKDKMEVDEA
jgi:hypothetical protein